MEFIIPLLLLAVSALFVWGLIAFLGRSAGVQKKSVGKSPALFDRMSEDGAAAAAQRLDEETHTQVYRHLAVGQLAQAAEVYHKATGVGRIEADRKSTRLNSSHVAISYAVFCLKKKKHEY